MSQLSFASLALYWSAAEIDANILIFMNILGAMILGLIVGYERSYHGRAAGMRIYGLVCMASAALTVIFGYPEYWYGTHHHAAATVSISQVIQGIVTGVGFLGAGVIMHEGVNISGLTTAASIWASSAIGILVGVGFYPAAIMLTLLSAFSMTWVSNLESWLPARHAIAVGLRFKRGFVPRQEILGRAARKRGYQLATASIGVSCHEGCSEWRFVLVALSRKSATPLTDLASELAGFEAVDSFTLSHARN